MRDERVSMERDAVESMQSNLNRGGPAIVASYGLIGAIMLLGGAGWAADRYLGTGPWCLLTGLITGVGIGFCRGALAVQQFGADLLPLVMLFAVSITGVFLTVSTHLMRGLHVVFLSQLHAVTVIFTLRTSVRPAAAGTSL
jgi:hypothetical protein